MNKEKKIKYLAFDFDGVISEYKEFKGHSITSNPNMQVVEAIKILKKDGFKIIAYSTRGNDLLKKYCSENNIPIDYYNENPNKQGENPGKPIAHIYIDDRSLCYRGQKTEELVREIKEFKTYWQK